MYKCQHLIRRITEYNGGQFKKYFTNAANLEEFRKQLIYRYEY